MKSALAILILVVIGGCAAWYGYRHSAQPTLPSAELVVGQNLIIGVQGPVLTEANIAFLEKVKPAAIVLYKFNIESDEQITAFIKQLQEIAVRTTGKPYLIMSDEEPGGATRLGVFQDAFTGVQPNWDNIRRDVQKLKNIGINVVLSPLADLPLGGMKGSVSHRMPIRTHDELVDFNNKYIALLKKYGIAATLKHFPGVGITEGDTHKVLIRSTVSTSTVMQEIDVFREGIRGGADFVMTSQAIYNAIDPNHSSTISSTLIGMLRDDLRFKGLIVTDDMINMPTGNPEKMETEDAIVAAFKAGQSMVMLGSFRAYISEMHDKLLAAYRNDPDLKQILDSNYYRIMEYKAAYFNLDDLRK